MARSPDGSLPSLVLGGSLDLSVTLEPRVAWSPSVESRSHVRIRVEIIFCRANGWNLDAVGTSFVRWHMTFVDLYAAIDQ